MVLDTHGFLWIGTNAGLTRFDGAHFRTFPMPSGSEGSFAYSPRMMDVDRYNRLWIATKRGLYIFDISTERFEQYDTCMISDDEFIRFVRVDQSGNVWAASDKSQYCIDSENMHCRKSARGSEIDDMLSDMNNQKSVILDELRAESYCPGNVTTFASDDNGGIWLGTFFEGLYYYNNDRLFIDCITPSSFAEDEIIVVRNIVPWNNGLFVGTENNGLMWYASGDTILQPITLTWEGKSICPNIQSIISVNDDLWIGTAWDGIFVYDPSSGRIERHISSKNKGDGLSVDKTVCMLHTKSDDIVVGTVSGLYILPHGGSSFSVVKGLERGMMHALAETSDGRLWVGQFDGKMRTLTRKSDMHGNVLWDVKESGFDYPCVTCLFVDRSDHVLAGTDSRGVWKYEGGEWRATTLTYDKLKSSVNSLLMDKEGRIWVSTFNGIFCQDKIHGIPLHFSSSTDGMPTDLMNFSSSYMSPDGRIYFGSYKGLLTFHPSHLKHPAGSLEVYFTNVSIGMRDTLATDELRLNYDSPSLRIDYGISSYDQIHNAWFRYRLKGGSDSEWCVVQGGDQSIYFSHLSPGNYELELQGTINPSTWPEHSEIMRIIVSPPFWKSSLAWVIYILLAGAVLFMLLSLWRHGMERKNLRDQLSQLMKNKELMRNTEALSPYDLIKDITRNKTDNNLMERIDEFLESNLKNPQLQVEVLAEHLNMSKSTLYRRMKEVTSLSPNDYIRFYRLKHAAVLLRQEGMRIKDVSDLLCFSSVGYFTNCFSRQFGVTPGEYAKGGSE